MADFGLPVPRIGGTATRTRFDTIGMGTYGRNGIARAVLGSVAERLWQSPAAPSRQCGLGKESAVPRAILYATDFSSASRPAFRAALTLAKRMKRPLVVAHVIGPAVALAGDFYVSPAVYESVERSMRSAAQKRLDRLLAAARAKGLHATSLVLEGSAHEQIARAAKAKRAEIIVMGTHGRTGFTRLALGSVASRVLAAAPCPVLTVRGR